MNRPRVALFACAYNEIDGVANTMRHFEAFAKRLDLPLLSVHGGYDQYQERDGSVRRMEFRRHFPKFRLDAKHDFDLNFWRYYRQIEAAVRDFRADLVHITGPSDVGQLGALVAHRLRLPLVASWHTNVHEYAEKRLIPLCGLLPSGAKEQIGKLAREWSFRATARFYRIAQVLFAPNQELIAQLERATGKPCYAMARGVDTEAFHPQRRCRTDNQFTIGYVGRLTNEKNIRFLVELERALEARGHGDFHLVIVGQGAQEAWLRMNLKHAQFTGVLQGDELARAYANFDVFAFPSATDTFGNVVLEAMASGVPAVVTNQGGPKYIVEDGTTGFVAGSNEEFIGCVHRLLQSPALLRQMREAARERALRSSWDSVFQSVYDVYKRTIAPSHTPVALHAGLAEV